MATRSETAEIAVLQDQMTSVKESLVDIKADTKAIMSALSDIPVDYVPRSEFEEYKKEQKSGDIAKAVTYIIITAIITAMAYALIVGKVK